LIVIIVIAIINYLIIRTIKVEIESIKKDSLIINENKEKETACNIQGMISSMHDSLLYEIQKLDEKFDDIKQEMNPNEELSNDKLYEEAKKLVLESRKASASFLQRKLRIGYARATRIIDMLEEEKIISPADEMEPRKVLK